MGVGTVGAGYVTTGGPRRGGVRAGTLGLPRALPPAGPKVGRRPGAPAGPCPGWRARVAAASTRPQHPLPVGGPPVGLEHVGAVPGDHRAGARLRVLSAECGAVGPPRSFRLSRRATLRGAQPQFPRLQANLEDTCLPAPRLLLWAHLDGSILHGSGSPPGGFAALRASGNGDVRRHFGCRSWRGVMGSLASSGV